MVMVLPDFLDEIDTLKLIKMCLVHDLGEAISGDLPAPMQVGAAAGSKSAREQHDLESLTESLPPATRQEILMLWQEYERGISREAALAKAFDKIETLLQHIQGRNEKNFDYAFNLEYGRRYTDAHSLTKAIREIVDAETRKRIG